ncbi:VCBS repeat-containing protein [Streptomyces sp. NPDC058467]|uniref:VCBS repeat-containing protein n=1 Tax=unclassified Streptomyces TaxID=2593676 RepID=UPI00365D59FB
MFSLRSRARWAVPLAVGLVALGVGQLGTAEGAAARPAAPVRDDFNGDGYADLAIAADHATVGGQSKAGYVVVMYGGPHGLSATDGSRRTVISRATSGIPGSPVKGQAFGTQLSKGDLDGDGYADLVIGTGGAGDAVVVWGGSRGLAGGTSVPGEISQTGDFDGDGRLDLALFRPGHGGGDDPGGTEAVVWTGPVSRTGTPARSSALDPEHLQYVDVTGGATGDVDGDGREDLALSVYCGDGNYCTDLYRASASGLVRTGAHGGDHSVALGDINGDGYDDVVAGIGSDNRIDVAYGSASGIPQSATWKTFTQDSPGVPGADESNDMFGAAVAVGDVTGDGYDDVAVGAACEDLGDAKCTGDVTLLHGSRSGLTGTGAQFISQNTSGIPGTSETDDLFGYAVQLLDINGNGYADLTAAAPHENTGNGAVWELRGRPGGIVPDAALSFDGRTLGTPYTKAQFGFAVE